MTTTIAALIDQIAAEIEPATMSQDLDKARSAAHQQTMEHEQARVRGTARAILRRVWEFQREAAERANSPFRAAVARAWLADLEEDAA